MNYTKEETMKILETLILWYEHPTCFTTDYTLLKLEVLIRAHQFHLKTFESKDGI